LKISQTIKNYHLFVGININKHKGGLGFLHAEVFSQIYGSWGLSWLFIQNEKVFPQIKGSWA